MGRVPAVRKTYTICTTYTTYHKHQVHHERHQHHRQHGHENHEFVARWLGLPPQGELRPASYQLRSLVWCEGASHQATDEDHVNEELLMVRGKGQGLQGECFRCHPYRKMPTWASLEAETDRPQWQTGTGRNTGQYGTMFTYGGENIDTEKKQRWLDLLWKEHCANNWSTRWQVGRCLRWMWASEENQQCYGKEKRCWTADAWCRLDSSFKPQFGSEQDLESPEAFIPRDEESSEDDRPFPPRFLLQEIIFVHSPYEGVSHNRPCLRSRESSVQIRLASLARGCRNRMRDPPITRTRCLSLVQCVRTSQFRRAPSWRQRFSTNSAGSQIQCLGLGAWAEQTAPTPGAQTVSTTKIRTTGNCVGNGT